jgi:hypothetical protein
MKTLVRIKEHLEPAGYRVSENRLPADVDLSLWVLLDVDGEDYLKLPPEGVMPLSTEEGLDDAGVVRQVAANGYAAIKVADGIEASTHYSKTTRDNAKIAFFGMKPTNWLSAWVVSEKTVFLDGDAATTSFKYQEPAKKMIERLDEDPSVKSLGYFIPGGSLPEGRPYANDEEMLKRGWLGRVYGGFDFIRSIESAVNNEGWQRPEPHIGYTVQYHHPGGRGQQWMFIHYRTDLKGAETRLKQLATNARKRARNEAVRRQATKGSHQQSFLSSLPKSSLSSINEEMARQVGSCDSTSIIDPIISAAREMKVYLPSALRSWTEGRAKDPTNAAAFFMQVAEEFGRIHGPRWLELKKVRELLWTATRLWSVWTGRYASTDYNWGKEYYTSVFGFCYTLMRNDKAAKVIVAPSVAEAGRVEIEPPKNAPPLRFTDRPTHFEKTWTREIPKKLLHRLKRSVGVNPNAKPKPTKKSKPTKKRKPTKRAMTKAAGELAATPA